jgi:hypothetical protein
MTQGWNPQTGDYPRSPSNVQIFSSYEIGSYDIRWDLPALNPYNTLWTVLGVNIYRSDVSDRGPFFRINQYPLGSTFYRDKTQYIKIEEEVVTSERWVFQGDSPNNRQFLFRTNCPIVKPDPVGVPNQTPTFGNTSSDIVVKIDGVIVPVHEVFGRSGEVRLINRATIDWTKETNVDAVLPSKNSVVTATYYTARNFIRSGLDSKIHYRLTTVAVDTNNHSNMIETPLGYAEPHSNIEIENIDYIWREAMRRNNWILEQGGERVKFFIRRQSGVFCSCNKEGVDPRHREWSGQPSSRCVVCYGTGIVGGYDGPFPGIIGPDETDRRVSQQPTGRRLEHAYEVWTGPSPLVTQRDFLVKQTNERYSIGPVRRPSSRGNLLQQHFNIGYLDEQDIRYRVPLVDPNTSLYPETRVPSHPYQLAYPARLNQPGYPAYPNLDAENPPPYDTSLDTTYPMKTEKSKIGDEREVRGRTPVYEDHMY